MKHEYLELGLTELNRGIERYIDNGSNAAERDELDLTIAFSKLSHQLALLEQQRVSNLIKLGTKASLAEAERILMTNTPEMRKKYEEDNN